MKVWISGSGQESLVQPLTWVSGSKVDCLPCLGTHRLTKCKVVRGPFCRIVPLALLPVGRGSEHLMKCGQTVSLRPELSHLGALLGYRLRALTHATTRTDLRQCQSVQGFSLWEIVGDNVRTTWVTCASPVRQSWTALGCCSP